MYKEETKVLFKKYAVPQMIGLLLNSVYLIVDGIFIGNRLGRNSMAAAAISVPVVEILIAIAIAISVGGGILASSKLGNNEKDKANNIFNISIIVTAITAVIIMIFGNIFIDKIVYLMGSTDGIFKEAKDYLWYIITFSPFLLFSFVLSGFGRSNNKPKIAMIALVVGSISNIVLDYVFMYPLNMGIKGAALATALGPVFSVLILLPTFKKSTGNLYFKWPKVKLNIVRRILSLGFPAFMMEFTIGIVTFLYNYVIKTSGLGEIGLAAYLTIGYLALIILTIFLGLSQGVQPIISYFNGSNQHEKKEDLLKYSKKIIGILGILSYIAVILLGKNFIKLFTPDDLELIEYTYSKAIIYLSGFVFAGYNIICISYFQAIQNLRIAMIVALGRSVIITPILMVIFYKYVGKDSIWIVLSVTELIMAIVNIFFARKSKILKQKQ